MVRHYSRAPVGRLVRTAVVLLAALTCRSAAVEEDLRINVQPRLLPDDGRRARVIIGANDAYGDPGVGTVLVRSSAGSLREGISLVLGADGAAETALTCEAKQDPDCHDQVEVTAQWTSPNGVRFSRSVTLTIQTTDAFVSACAFQNRRVLKLLTGNPPAVQLAVLDTNPEVVRTAFGVSLWDAASGIGALALSLPSRGSTASDEESFARGLIASAGGVENPLVQTLTTWDGHPAARSTFALTTGADLKTTLERISTALGAGSTGLQGAASVIGPFRVELIAVHHEAGISSVVIALHAASGFTEAASFDLDDVAGGSAVAQAVDAPVDHCEIFTVEGTKKVDFLWVVDDSCSMESSQQAVASVGIQASQKIQAAQLDFRVAGVSTGWYPPYYFGSYRPWTGNLTQMLSWFRGPGAFGTGGTGLENGFDALATFMDGGSVGTEFRPDSEVHIIFLSDTKDQSELDAFGMKALLDARFPKQRVIVSGIVCPEGKACGDEPEELVGDYHTLIRETGGVLGSIDVFNPVMVTPALQAQQVETMNRIIGNVVTGAGYQLKHKPITASVRVAASAVRDPRCDNRDIPRSTEHGWDLDPTTGRIAFYGNCAPMLGGTMVISYKSWARYGTQLVETTTPKYAVAIPDGGAGGVDAGAVDAGTADAGDVDAGAVDAGDGG